MALTVLITSHSSLFRHTNAPTSALLSDVNIHVSVLPSAGSCWVHSNMDGSSFSLVVCQSQKEAIADNSLIELTR